MPTENKKKKILYCITKANWGGAQKYVFDLALALDPALFEVVVLLGGEGALLQALEAKGIRVLILDKLTRDISTWKDIVSFYKIIKIFKKEKPDIIHLNSSKMGLLGALAGRLLRIPKIIFTGHGWAFNEDRSAWQKKIIFFLHRLTVKLSHSTIAVSEQTKNQILRKKEVYSKIISIHNGVSEIDFLDKNLAREKILSQINQGEPLIDLEGRLWLGTISELHKNKGLKYLIEAIHLLDLSMDDKAKLPLVIVIGEGEKRDKLQKRIDRYGLNNTIFLVGRMENASKYLKIFDIFILTSITEALGYVLLEAGQAGLPVIASSVGGIPEIIEDMVSGLLVRPKEPEEIKKAIEFLLANPERAKIFAENIKQKILTDFSKDKMVQRTVELY
jgi:glycosyltransferase involved in cell wall biosynthesis